MLAEQQACVAMLVEHVVVAVLRHVVLEHAEAVGVNGADEHGPEPVAEIGAHTLGDAAGDALLQFLRRALGEGESDDGSGLCALCDEGGDAAGDRLGFSGAGAGDDLEVGAAVGDHCLLRAGQIESAGAAHLILSLILLRNKSRGLSAVRTARVASIL